MEERKLSDVRKLYLEMKNKRDTEYTEPGQNKSGCLKALGIIMKVLLIAIIVAIFSLLGFRLYEQKTPKALTRILWNEKTIAAYNEDSTAFSVTDCEINQNFTEDGYFFVDKIMLLNEADQVQLTVSYNNSTVRYLEESYRKEDPSAVTGESSDSVQTEYDPYGVYSGEPFIYILYDKNGTVYDDYSYVSSSSLLHSFRRLIFDGIPCDAEGLSLAIFRANDIADGVEIGTGDGKILPWREIVIVDESTDKKEHKISSKEACTGSVTDGLVKIESAVNSDSLR